LQVAGHDVVDRLAGKRGAQQGCLALAFGVEGDVEVALQALLGIPGGFAMADQEDGGGGVLIRKHEARLPEPRSVQVVNVDARSGFSEYTPKVRASSRIWPRIARRSSAPPKRPTSGKRGMSRAYSVNT